MKVIVYGILLASYLRISYRLKELVARAGGMAGEILITFTLLISVTLPQGDGLFVWSLFALMVIHQLVQLRAEVKTKIKAQRQERHKETRLSRAA